MKILTLGDVVGQDAVAYLATNLRKKREELEADLVTVNAENATEVRGVCAKDARRLIDAGADLLTLGNHTYGMRDLYELLEDPDFPMIRPANYPPTAPGYGYRTVNVGGYRILCINVLGAVHTDFPVSPFDSVDRVLARENGKYDFALLDIHAEATSEKWALARYFDKRITVMFGTHTHVQTADEQVLPGGSGYITDLGMSGPVDGVLGTDAATVIQKFLTYLPAKFTPAKGDIAVCGALFDVDETKRCVRSVTRIRF